MTKPKPPFSIPPSKPRDDVADALAAGEIAKFGNPFEWPDGESNSPLRQLSQRLGVFSEGSWITTLALVGMELAKNEPELGGGKRRRGRPKRIGPSIDYDRFQKLYLLHGEELGNSITQVAAIEQAMDDGEPLFDGERDALIASVSDGKTEFFEERRKVGQFLAETRRLQYNSLRERWQLLQEIESDATRLDELNRDANYVSPGGLFGFGLPSGPERLELRARLTEVLARIRRISDNYAGK